MTYAPFTGAPLPYETSNQVEQVVKPQEKQNAKLGTLLEPSSVSARDVFPPPSFPVRDTFVALEPCHDGMSKSRMRVIPCAGVHAPLWLGCGTHSICALGAHDESAKSGFVNPQPADKSAPGVKVEAANTGWLPRRVGLGNYHSNKAITGAFQVNMPYMCL